MDPIIAAAATSFVTAIATNSTKKPIETLDNLWYLAFGKFNLFAEQQKAKHQVALEEYKNSIAKKVLAIDENNIQEPPMSVVGPALEASKYYIEEESLRDMFANVIAASMDKSKSSSVHNSFVEIIKQLSPEDARNILLFKSSDDYPIVQFRRVVLSENGGYQILKSNVFHGYESDIITGDENATSSTNLNRLGLTSISYEESYKDENQYDLYKNSTFFKNLQSITDEFNYEFKKGVLKLTPYGQSFINACL